MEVSHLFFKLLVISNGNSSSISNGDRYFWVLIAILIIVIIVTITLWLKFKNIKEEMVGLKKEINRRNNKNELIAGNAFKNNPEKWSEEISRIKNSINSFDKEWSQKYEELNQKVNNFISNERNGQPTLRSTTSKPNDQPPQEELSYIYYLSEVYADSSFNLKDASDQPTESSIYKIEIERGNTSEGSFVLIDSRGAKQRINTNKENYINKVADETEGVFKKEALIKTDVPGRLRLEGDKWVIQQKAKIHYE